MVLQQRPSLHFTGLRNHYQRVRFSSGEQYRNKDNTWPNLVETKSASWFDQVNALSEELEKFFGKEPLHSKDLSSIINGQHYNRLVKLLEDDEVSGKIVHGGERDKSKL